MWQRLKSQIVKELLSVLRDPRSRMVLVGPPLMQLFIFSFAATLEVENIDLAILDHDSGRWSHELTARVTSTKLIGRVLDLESSAQLEHVIDTRQALAALIFQPDFSRRIGSGQAATVQVVLDGRRGNAAQITLGYLNTIVEDLNADIARRATTGAAGSARAAGSAGSAGSAGTVGAAGAAHVAATSTAGAVETRHWFNPNLEYLWFTVPALVGMLSMFSALIVTSLSIARERELGTFDQLLVSPAHPAEIIAGKCIPALIIGTLLGSVMIAAGIFVFRIPFTGSVWMLYGSLALFILSVVGLGLMISSISRTQQQAILGAFAAGVPLVLLSGFATPVENMPQILQWVAQADPLQHFLVIVQGTFLKALPPAAIWARLWPIALIAAVTLGAALVFVQQRLK